MELLPVMLNTKRGCIVKGDFATFPIIVEQAGLKWEVINDWGETGNFAIASSAVMLEMAEQFDRVNADPSMDRRSVFGWFLSYPECCVKSFIDDAISEKHSGYWDFPDFIVGYTPFREELFDHIRLFGDYPRWLDYQLPGFNPCSIYCKETHTLLTNINGLLEQHDPEAAENLKFTNRKQFPFFHFHQDWLASQYRSKELPYKTYKLNLAVKSYGHGDLTSYIREDLKLEYTTCNCCHHQPNSEAHTCSTC